MGRWVGTRSTWHNKSVSNIVKEKYVCFQAAIIQGVH